MRKDLSCLKKSRWLLLTIFSLLLGSNSMWAEELTEDFNALTVTKQSLSNGWFVQGTNSYGTSYLLNPSQITNFSDAFNYSYELCKQGRSGGSIVTSKASNPAYIVIPVQLTGTVTFYAASYKTSNGSCNVFEVTEDNGVYTIGTTSLTNGAISLPKKTSSSAQPTWNEIKVELGDNNKMIAITLTYGAIDDFKATKFEESQYKRPASLTFSNITSSSASITWSSGSGDNSETGWDLEYKTSDSNTWNEVHGLSVSTLTYTLDNLLDNTTYDIRIKARYGENESGWRTDSFKTLKAPITSFPWTETFNGLTSGIPDGWDNSEGTTTNESYKWTSYASGHDGRGIRFNSYNNSNNYTNFLKTPVLSFTQNAPMQLKFWYKNPTGGDFSVYISNDGGVTYTTELATGLTGASNWTEKVIDLPTDVFYDNVVIVFKGTSNWGSGDAYIYLDDVMVKENADYAMSISGSDVVSNTIAFGEVKNTSTTKTFTISNDGASTLTGITVISSDASVFTVSDTNFDLATGETRDITVTFVKGVVGDYSETVTISQANVAMPTTLTVTGSYALPAAATIAVKVGSNAVGETVAFGNVGKQKSIEITVENSGEADLNISSITSSNTTDFIVSPSTLIVQGGSSKTFTVTFTYPTENADLNSEKTATITVTPSNGGLNSVTFAVTGTRIELWSEDFAADAVPTAWDAGANWTISGGVAKAVYAYGSTSYLTTPVLTVTDATEELTFDYKATANYVSVKIQMSKDGGAFADYQTISGLNNGDAGTYTITGLEAGDYQFRFANDDYELDNFEGFKLKLADHIVTISASSIPDSPSYSISMKENRSFDATVTVKEMRGVAEALTAKLVMGTEVIGTATGNVAANSEETLTITATPTVAAPDGAQMHIEVEYAGGTLATDEVTRYVAALTYLTLDETSPDAVVAGTYDEVTLKRKFAEGWNTVCLPFTINDVESFFGAGAKAYNFEDYNNGELRFTVVNKLTASFPYIVYVPAAITSDIALTDITINSSDTEGWYTTHDEAKFQGTYAPMTAGQLEGKYGVVPSTGKIQKGGATATMKGFRAYFELPAGTGARLSFTDVTTGITTVMDASELGDDAFNLKGQRVENLKKGGLYIIGGKKVIVK